MRHVSPDELTAPRRAEGKDSFAGSRSPALPGSRSNLVVSLAVCTILLIAAVLSSAVMIVHGSLVAGAIALLSIAVIVALIGRQLSHAAAEAWRVADAHRRKLHAALDNMSQGLVMFDAEGRLVLCNQRFLTMYNLPAEAIRPGMSLREFLERCARQGLDCDPEQYGLQICAAVATAKTQSWSTEMPDGRAIRVVIHPVGDGWLVTHEDITEQLRAEKERDRSRDFLDLIIENVPATIWVKNARDGRYLLVNRACEKLWGLERTEIVGKTTAEIFAPAEAAIIAGRDEALLRSDGLLVLEEHALHTPANGIKTVTSRRLAIRQNNGERYLLGVVDDVSGRKLMERQLQQAQKMEAVGNLTGGLAHDFNNLLLIIIGNLDLLQQDIAGNAAAEEKMEIIVEASLRGAELTRQLLAFSRRQPLQPKRIEVNALVGSTMRLLTRTLGETITYDVRPGAGLWPVRLDEAQLESALVNIAINARDAMPDGGTLRISTSNQHVDADLAGQHPEFAPGDYVMIEITDTGTGMPPDIVARIFEPFFTTKAPGKGSGLGLSMVYGFMKQSKGHISAYSEVGIGTTFRMYLPRHVDAVASADAPAAAQRQPARAKDGEVILVVDDNPDVRTAVTAQLQSLGYAVLATDGAQAALDQLGKVRVDLLFTDMVMPGGLSGKDLAERARTRFPRLKVLFTSGFPGETLGSGLGVRDRLLSKPYRKWDLAQAVRDLLDQPAA